MTDGQRRALRQLQDIASQGPALKILDVREPSQLGGFLVVDVVISCDEFERRPGGLPLGARERFRILVDAEFPFRPPSVGTPHTRFEGYPHVQWGRHFCLYQAPSTEWDASDGMLGFVDRLRWWLTQAALGELDPIGAPLHPPVTYSAGGPYRMVIPRRDTPQVDGVPWFGLAQLKTVAEHRVDVVDWIAIDADAFATAMDVAAAILLNKPMPFEFPGKVSDLATELVKRGVSQRDLLRVLQCAAAGNPDDAPLYVIIGTPMRGIAGGARRQHLTAWCIDPTIAKGLRLALHQYSTNPKLAEIGREVETLILNWAEVAQVAWCDVREARPEVVVPRDRATPMGRFAGRAVSIWGCGALGGHIAEMLVRAGVRRLVLRDNAAVAPGILVRQPYDDADLGYTKVTALQRRLLRIRPELETEVHNTNILTGSLGGGDWTDGADVLIDATASEKVLAKLELRRREQRERRISVVSMAMGHDASRALVVTTQASHSGGPADVVRRAKIEVCSRGSNGEFADEFWPRDRHPMFQPEPGCSEPTFVGSAADAAGLSGLMLNVAACSLQDGERASATATFISQATLNGSNEPATATYSWAPDRVFADPHSGYEIRVSAGAWADIEGWVRRAQRVDRPDVETGGLLFGERDDAIGVIWVSEVIGPPPDSDASESGFVCGVEGTGEANKEKKQRTRGSVRYVGTWHSHPGSAPLPSSTDFAAMDKLINSEIEAPASLLLLIVGGSPAGSEAASFVFDRKDFVSLRSRGWLSRRCAVAHQESATRHDLRIGLALSGGGSRAIAFHLGCLRALHDRHILDQVQFISAVSGGSVITGMYAYSDDSFEEFDARVVRLLRTGLTGAIASRFLLSGRLPGALLTALGPGVAAAAASGARGLLGTLARMRGGGAEDGLSNSKYLQAPFQRWTSRTDAFEAALQDLLFGSATLTSERRAGIDVVLNAAELRTGTAFRFGSRESACWRYGRVRDNTIPLSFAVAASAAYPALLPAIDRVMTFTTRSGEERQERVIITDGGVYDNLGLSCLAPGRSAEFSSNLFPAEYIICCDAGAGQLADHVVPFWWPSRMARSFATTFRRSVERGYRELHDWQRNGAIRGFVLSYLGQQDRNLPYLPPDLVRREEVADYPTDFSPMRPEDIASLTKRGEQLTRLLVSHYIPEV